MISSQIWFCALSWRGRLRRLVARAFRMRSSARARRRCRSSSWAMGVPVVLVAKQVSRSPSASVNRSWAPGCGRSLRTISRMPFGQPLSTSPSISATQAPSRISPPDSTATVQAVGGTRRTAW